MYSENDHGSKKIPIHVRVITKPSFVKRIFHMANSGMCLPSE